MISFIISILTALLTQLQAAEVHPESSEVKQEIERAMNYMVSEPQKAVSLADSLYKTGKISEVKRRYLEAMVTYYGLQQPDSSATMCADLLDNFTFEDDPALEAEICSLMATIATSLDRDFDVIRYATKGAALCHGLEGYVSTEADLLGRVGLAKFKIGQRDEGIKMMQESLDAVRNDKTYSGLVARINIRKKLAKAESEAGRYDDAIRIAQDALDDLSKAESHPTSIEGLPEGWQANGGLNDLIAFGRGQLYGRLASTYSSSGNRDQAAAYLQKFEDAGADQNPLNLSTVLNVYVDLGMYSKLADASDKLFQVYASDTLSQNYTDVIDFLAKAEKKQGHLAQACSLMERSEALKTEQHQKQDAEQIAQMMALYEVQDAKMARLDAEAKLKSTKNTLSFTILLFLLAILGAVIGIVVKRKKETEAILADTKTDLQETNEQITDLMSDISENQGALTGKEEELYKKILEIMETKKPYLDPEFNINMLSSMIESNRTYTSMAINIMSGKPFRQWLTEYRIAEVVKILESNPDVTIDELCNASGYINTSTLYHNFKKIHGVTIREYARTAKNS